MKRAFCVAAALAFAACATAQEAALPGFTMERAGNIHDFDYFEGAWTTTQHRLRTRTPGSNDWEDFPGTLCMTRYLDGAATVDELYFPTRRAGGLTLRLFDRAHGQWAIYWVNSAIGRLDPIPVVGGFEGNRGEFYARDTIDGRSIKVRYLWTIIDHDHARWEQAFSFDDRTWDTNWVAAFTRAEPAALCERGQPRR